MQLIRLKNLKEMRELADLFIENLPSASKEALVVGLFGDLGSGKTTFVQKVAERLKVKEQLVSPTFVIQKKYRIGSERCYFKNLIHIDAYRLEGKTDLLNLGWDEIKNNPQNLIFIEWPERVADIFNADMRKIHFKFIDENTREIFYEDEKS